MATNNIKPIVATTRIANDAGLHTPEPPHAARRKVSQPALEDQSSIGQFSLEGVTAYYSVKHGNIAVFQLVEDATGKVIREVAPDQMLRISSAIDQILNRKDESEAAAITQKK